MTPQRTLGQAAIQWLLAEPRVMTVLPNIYDREQLREFAAAPDTPAHGRRIGAHQGARRQNFGVEEEPMKFKGTMTPPDARPSRMPEADSTLFTPHAPAPVGPYSQAIRAGYDLLQRTDPARPGHRQARRRRR